MKSINSKNIFDVVKEKYAPDQPKKNHKIDPIYSLFDRNGPLPKCQELAFFTDTSICTGCKSCEVACKQWNQLESDLVITRSPAYLSPIVTITPATFPQIIGAT